MVSTANPGSGDESVRLELLLEYFKKAINETNLEVIESKEPFINLSNIRVYDKVSFLDNDDNKAFTQARKDYIKELADNFGLMINVIDGFFFPSKKVDYYYFDTNLLESRLAVTKDKKIASHIGLLIREKKNAKNVYQCFRKGFSIKNICESTKLSEAVVKNHLLKLSKAGLVLSTDDCVYSINQFRDYVLLELGKIY